VLTFAERVPAHPVPEEDCSSSALPTLTLPFDGRQKSRFRARLDDGREAAVMLPRGTVLRHGDVLVAEDGTRVSVHAEPERVSVATAADALSALRAAYHLGNRHVPLQIAEEQLIYRHDHVLDAMLEQLGVQVSERLLPFEPETGAYGHSHTAHAHAEEPEHETPPMPEPDIPTRLELARPLRQR
jgi:urease accessory protein